MESLFAATQGTAASSPRRHSRRDRRSPPNPEGRQGLLTSNACDATRVRGPNALRASALLVAICREAERQAAHLLAHERRARAGRRDLTTESARRPGCDRATNLAVARPELATAAPPWGCKSRAGPTTRSRCGRGGEDSRQSPRSASDAAATRLYEGGPFVKPSVRSLTLQVPDCRVSAAVSSARARSLE
jgi:hypothetical protein